MLLLTVIIFMYGDAKTCIKMGNPYSQREIIASIHRFNFSNFKH